MNSQSSSGECFANGGKLFGMVLHAMGAFLLLFLQNGSPSQGSEPIAASRPVVKPTDETGVKPLLHTYCFDCHGNLSAEAGVNLEKLTSEPDFATQFKTWEKVTEMLRQRKMPPVDSEQPTDSQREQILKTIREKSEALVRKQAGDPGRVAMRRLTSAEYAYTIQDLTGLDLGLEKIFVSDAVGGEGFTNVGDAQFIQDSTLERYLEAGRSVASHAVIGAGPLQFFPDPGETGRELSAMHRIQQIYRRHGFRTGAGEGAEPFGLDRYPKAFYAAWRYRNLQKLGEETLTLSALAAEEGLDVRFLEHIRSVLNEPATSFPTSAVVNAWQSLPVPDGKDESLEKQIRSRCDVIYALLRSWQSTLGATSGDEEEAAVLTEGEFHVSPEHSFKANVEWPLKATRASAEFSVSSASEKTAAGSLVIWKNLRVRFRREDKSWTPRQPLTDWLTRETIRRLKFGRHPQGIDIDHDDFVLPAGKTASIAFHLPKGTTDAELYVDVELDLEHGKEGIVRCAIDDGEVEGETAAEIGTTSVLLANPDGNEFALWKTGVMQFARKLPEVSHREPAPSDRDPIPAPFDNTYNTAERNLFHYRIKYHRDDQFLVNHILDDSTRRLLDEAWTDLLTSFEYHDAYLNFVAQKHKLDLPGDGIADVDQAFIDGLPAELQNIIQWLRDSWVKSRQALKTAEPGYVEDALGFARLAWRRPLSEQEQNRLRSFYERMRNGEGLAHSEAIRTLLTRILVAPAFLYRVENPPDQPGIVPLSDTELAGRLSYFLWSSPPDAELRRAAASGELQHPDKLAQQARRMLRDPRARRFATEFFGQWFGFYRFDGYRGVDADRFPEFTDSLKTAMYDEAVSFFEHVIRNDRPIDEILFADYSFLNRELAAHYGIEAKTDLPDSPVLVDGLKKNHRGGLLRLGAVLTATSAPRRTSPVKRGDWILRRVLGTPVPTPPADAGSIPADDVLPDGLTLRERLVAHRREASCVNCHSRFDPLGFALEHFDAVGRRRERYRDGQAIDSSGTLQDGTKITGSDGLRRYLKSRNGDFHRTFCTKLLGYALGRNGILTDRPLIERMMADAESDGRFSRLVEMIVTSRQFRHRRGRDEITQRERKNPPHETAGIKGTDDGDR